jgi:YfiR/HmsC-like
MLKSRAKPQPILKRLSRCMTAFCCLLFIINSPLSNAKSETEIKAVYLYNFIKFVNWPDLPEDSHYKLCLLGNDSLNEQLERLDKRSIKGRLLSVHALSNYQQATDCNILFVGQSEKKFVSEIISASENTPTLTISDIEDFANLGGIIGFIKLGNVIRFDINLNKAQQTKLSISSKLLELANQVVK